MTTADLPFSRALVAFSWADLRNRFYAPVDGSLLVFSRIAFGSIMIWEAWLILSKHWVEEHYMPGVFHFTYWPFDFVQPWPSPGMEIHIVAIGVLGGMIALGLFYRFAAVCLFFAFTYVFLLEQTRYLNHFYLVCLFSCLLIFLPLNRQFSLDALINRGGNALPMPTWALWILSFQVAAPMFFSGIAKLNADWLRGEPLRTWMQEEPDFPILGQFFFNEPIVWCFVYGAIMLDLCFSVYMLHHRTRIIGFCFVLFFHFANERLFNLGIFPCFMVVASMLFFSPDLLTRMWRDIQQSNVPKIFLMAGGFILGGSMSVTSLESWSLVPFLAGALGLSVALYSLPELARTPQPTQATITSEVPARQFSTAQRVGLTLAVLWVLFQVITPLRHFAVPGYVNWTEEGRKYSWNMMVRSKNRHDDMWFTVIDPRTNSETTVNPRDYLTGRQMTWMAARPNLLVQFAHAQEKKLLDTGGADIEIYAHVKMRMNDRNPQTFIDPNQDLTEVPRVWVKAADWIIPLEGRREFD